jgi:hypothetical protein
MRIKYPKAIQESEEELTKLEQRLRGQKTADRVRMLRLLKSATVKSLRVLCADGRLQCEPADALVGTLSGRGAGRDTQAAEASGEGLEALPRGMGGLVASDASRTHHDHARCPQLLGEGVGHCLQERQVPVVALQETSGQVEDGTPPAQESQCRAAGSF